MHKELLIAAFLTILLTLSGCRKDGNPIDPCDCNRSDSLPFPVKGLVAYYPLDGNSNDSSGNNYHGIVHHAEPATNRFGRPGKAYLFDGIDDYIAVPKLNGTKLEMDSAITISCFIRATASHGRDPWSRIVMKEAAFGDGYVLSWDQDNNGRLQSFMLYNSTPARFSTPNDNVSFENSQLVGSWHHVVTTYSLATRVLTLYVDGNLVAQKTNCRYNFEHSSDELGIGGVAGPISDARGVTRYNSFPGSIDDVRIYDRVLSPAEIKALFHEGGYKR